MAYFLGRSLLALIALCALPLLVGDYWAYQLGLYFLYALAALGVGVAWGQAGILSLGQGMFIGLAAYVSANWLLVTGSSPAGYLAIPLAVLATTLVGFIIAAVIFRNRIGTGPAFSLITMALTLAATQVAMTWTAATGGFNGLRGVPDLFALDGFLKLYVLIAVVLIAGIAAVEWIVRAPIGTLWRAGAGNELRLAFLGYNTGILKACAFALCGLLAGLAGAFYAPQQNLVTPDLAGFDLSGQMVVFAAVGGRSTILGPVIGAISVGILSAELRDRIWWWEIVVAVFFIFVVLRLPGGVMTIFGRWVSLRPLLRDASHRIPAPPRRSRAPEPASIGFDDVRVTMGEVTILDGLSFATAEERILCVIGPNGAGKTSTLNVLTGTVPLRSGTIEIDGRVLPRPRPAAVARLGVARKFQTPSVFPDLLVQENLAIALWSGRARWFDLLRPGPFCWTTPVLDELRRRFPFLAEGETKASALSHGQRQILEFSMAAVTEPRLLLLDEPCAGLSHDETATVIAAIQWLQQQLQFRIIIIEHDMELVKRLSDRVVVFHQGRYLAGGTISEVQANRSVQAVYVGGAR